jgi:hypothetical protein
VHEVDATTCAVLMKLCAVQRMGSGLDKILVIIAGLDWPDRQVFLTINDTPNGKRLTGSQVGETLTDIATRYGITVRDLKVCLCARRFCALCSLCLYMGPFQKAIFSTVRFVTFGTFGSYRMPIKMSCTLGAKWI